MGGETGGTIALEELFLRKAIPTLRTAKEVQYWHGYCSSIFSPVRARLTRLIAPKGRYLMSGAVRTPSRQEPTHGPLEDLQFQPSSENSVGIELELQILDRDTGDLCPGAVRLLAACAQEGLEEVTAELMQSQLEVKTGVCRNVAELRAVLFPLLRRVRIIANSLGYDLALGGTHPFNRAANSAVFPAERYQRIHDQMAWLTYQGLVFGLHVHVGVTGGDMAIGVMNTLVQYLPHLLALSASSPFWGRSRPGL